MRFTGTALFVLVLSISRYEELIIYNSNLGFCGRMEKQEYRKKLTISESKEHTGQHRKEQNANVITESPTELEILSHRWVLPKRP